MATRAIIRIADRTEGVSFNEHPLISKHHIYHHYDGYPEYLGVTLANYLSDISVVNGISSNTKVANGLGCLAAQLVCHLKLVNAGCDQDGKINIPSGNVYLDPWDLGRNDVDYIYYVWAAEGKDVWISIFERSTDDEYSLCTFVGTPDKLLKKYKGKLN